MKVLDRCWINCLRMWKWLSENLPEGFLEKSNEEKEDIVDFLKKQWLEKNRFTTPIDNDCFFCGYDGKYEDDCCNCPARLVDPEFHCDTLEYSYKYRPSDFYQEIWVLNARRRSE